MRLINRVVQCKSRSEKFFLYVLGDVHIGARNCAEKHFRRMVRKIKNEPNALWIGGGDLIEAIKMQDKRWSWDSLPDWILEGDVDTVRAKLKDVVHQQEARIITALYDIREKGLGLILGNHEDACLRRFEVDVQRELSEALELPDLTDCAFVRLQFKRLRSIKTVIIFICHGHGGGRTPGAEPNHLDRLMKDKDADIVLRGHSHTMEIRPPIPILYIPKVGELPEECRERYKRGANWGCWLKSYAVGSSYASKACYPARVLGTVEIVLEPHLDLHGEGVDSGRIAIRECVL